MEVGKMPPIMFELATTCRYNRFLCLTFITSNGLFNAC